MLACIKRNMKGLTAKRQRMPQAIRWSDVLALFISISLEEMWLEKPTPGLELPCQGRVPFPQAPRARTGLLALALARRRPCCASSKCALARKMRVSRAPSSADETAHLRRRLLQAKQAAERRVRRYRRYLLQSRSQPSLQTLRVVHSTIFPKVRSLMVRGQAFRHSF